MRPMLREEKASRDRGVTTSGPCPLAYTLMWSPMVATTRPAHDEASTPRIDREGDVLYSQGTPTPIGVP